MYMYVCVYMYIYIYIYICIHEDCAARLLRRCVEGMGREKFQAAARHREGNFIALKTTPIRGPLSRRISWPFKGA